MAATLSIIGLAISVYQVAERVSTLLSKAKRLHHAPSELFALNNEVSDLRITVQNVEQCLSTSNEGSIALSENKLKHVGHLIDTAKEELLDLEKLIHYQFLKSGTLEGNFKVFRLRWVKTKPLVTQHREAIYKIRQNILMELQTIGMYYSPP